MINVVIQILYYYSCFREGSWIRLPQTAYYVNWEECTWGIYSTYVRYTFLGLLYFYLVYDNIQLMRWITEFNDINRFVRSSYCCKENLATVFLLLTSIKIYIIWLEFVNQVPRYIYLYFKTLTSFYTSIYYYSIHTTI